MNFQDCQQQQQQPTQYELSESADFTPTTALSSSPNFIETILTDIMVTDDIGNQLMYKNVEATFDPFERSVSIISLLDYLASVCVNTFDNEIFYFDNFANNFISCGLGSTIPQNTRIILNELNLFDTSSTNQVMKLHISGDCFAFKNTNNNIPQQPTSCDFQSTFQSQQPQYYYDQREQEQFSPYGSSGMDSPNSFMYYNQYSQTNASHTQKSSTDDFSLDSNNLFQDWNSTEPEETNKNKPHEFVQVQEPVPQPEKKKRKSGCLKAKRHPERTVGQVIQLISDWRMTAESTNSTLEKVAADVLHVPRKSLDDYMRALKLGKQYEFDFNAHMNDKMGILREFIRKAQNKAKNVHNDNSTESSFISASKKIRKNPIF
mmetsp:Transcript_7327/g.6667  ORF Transcript_7327/g.6667 Transcript_7327/m.6667 type:complete len:376 (-) Transcript_7327:667-1794(-)